MFKNTSHYLINNQKLFTSYKINYIFNYPIKYNNNIYLISIIIIKKINDVMHQIIKYFLNIY